MSASENALPENQGSADGDADAAKRKRAPRKQTFSERWRRMSLPNQLMFLATLVIAVATVANVAVFIAQSISSSGQTNKLVGYAKTQANAASDISDASQQFSDTAEDINERMSEAVDQLTVAATNAKASIRATQDAMRLDQRAWVVVKGIGPSPEANKQWNLRVVFSDTGKTPAKSFTASCAVEPADSEQAIKWTLSHFDGGSLLVPNDQHFCTLHPFGLGKLTQEAADYLTSQSAHNYVYGAAIYQDIFGRWHWLTFCSGMRPGAQEWQDCDNGNDTGDGNVPPPPFDKAAKPN
jgi:hypothetical protein